MSTGGINKVILVGNLGADPEVRYTRNNEAIANLSVATSLTWKDKRTGEPREQTEWHRCVAYRRLAEVCGEYLSKGSKVYIEGRLQTRKWQGQDGVERYTTEVIITDLQMLDGRKNANQQPQKQSSQHAATGTNVQQPNPLQHNQQSSQPPPDFDDDIPFAPIAKQYRALLNCM